jgi:hypothetical protein
MTPQDLSDQLEALGWRLVAWRKGWPNPTKPHSTFKAAHAVGSPADQSAVTPDELIRRVVAFEKNRLTDGAELKAVGR